MDGRVEVLPDEGVMLNIPKRANSDEDCEEVGALLNIVLRGDIARSEVPDTIDRDNTNVLYSSQEVLKNKHQEEKI